MKRIGIDGCRGGWLLALGDEEPGALSFALVGDLAPIFAEAEARRAVIAIDIPIGLGDSEGRRCDAEARKLLGSRASSVFTAPSRAALAGGSYLEACDLNEAACGKRLSQQAYGILKSIAAVDRLMRPDLQGLIREVHPEVTLAVVAGGGIQEPKKTPAGHAVRLAVLERLGIEPDVERVRDAFGRGKVAPDDVLDACIALVTAYRLIAGEARVLPEGWTQHDTRGLRMEMTA